MTTTPDATAPTLPLERKRGCLFYVKRGLLALLLVVVALLVAGFVYETQAEAADASAYPPPGELIDVGGYRLHIYCTGEGSPTVILDAGGGFTSSSWAWVQPEVAQTTRVCSYDRAGWGWSDPSPIGYDALQNAAELHTLLANAGITPPIILVGHSLGGLYDRVYAQQYPDEVAGLVQVDASHPDAWRQMGMREGANADPQMLAMGPFVARLGLLRLMQFTPPDPDLPERQRNEMLVASQAPKFADTALAFDRAFPDILAQAREVTSLGSLPMIVLTTSEVDAAATDEAVVLRPLQLELAQLSTGSTYQVVEGANHVTLVHKQEYAEQVSAAIRAMVEAVRSGEPLSS